MVENLAASISSDQNQSISNTDNHMRTIGGKAHVALSHKSNLHNRDSRHVGFLLPNLLPHIHTVSKVVHIMFNPNSHNSTPLNSNSNHEQDAFAAHKNNK